VSVVITGATGLLGAMIIGELIGRGVPADTIVGAGRNADRLAALERKGARTARIDFSEPASLAAAFHGAQKVLLVSGSEVGRRVPQHQNVIDAAATAGVGLLAYTSALDVGSGKLALGAEHLATEKAIEASGLPAVLLRNGWYSENYEKAMRQAAQTGVLLASVGDGRVASASRPDFAAATAAVLATDGHERRVYELSGDAAWDYDELAAAFAQVLGRDVAYQRVSPQEHLAALTAAGLPEEAARFVTGLDADIRNGALALVTGDLSRLAGRPSTPLAETLRSLS
jgi:NAD(P)H dehydrogenase (quinone)